MTKVVAQCYRTLQAFGDVAWDDEVAEADARTISSATRDFREQTIRFFFTHQLADIREDEAINRRVYLLPKPALRVASDDLYSIESLPDDGKVRLLQVFGNSLLAPVPAEKILSDEIVRADRNFA